MDDVAPAPAGADDKAGNKRRRVARSTVALAAPAVETGGRAGRDPGESGVATGGRSSGRGKHQTMVATAITIVDLPDTILSSVAGYLPTTPISRAVFAAAMTSAPNDGQSLFGLGDDDVEELNFSEVERGLASKLSDQDIASILRLVDAGNKLKSLDLGGCVGITGAGLESLRGSSVLEEIDLMIPGGVVSAISNVAVIPILRSIVEQNNSSLKRISLPEKWSPNAKGSVLYAFLDDHDVCVCCGKIAQEDDSFVGCDFEGSKVKDCDNCYPDGAGVVVGLGQLAECTRWCKSCDTCVCDEHAAVWMDEKYRGCDKCFRCGIVQSINRDNGFGGRTSEDVS